MDATRRRARQPVSLFRHLGWIATGALVLLALGAPAIGPAAATGGPGAIWTTSTGCVAPQDQNHYAVGEVVYVRGANFAADMTYAWTITGQPGHASSDPGVVVASGSVTADGEGAFCLKAYTVQPGDRGEYTVDVEGAKKNDNYRVRGTEPEEPSTPALAITKGVSLASGSGYGASLKATVGATVHYRIVVTNTGNVTLTGVTLSDSVFDLAAKGCAIPTTLAPTASFTCDYGAVAKAGTTVNTATADSSQTGPATDTATVKATEAPPASPALTIDKSVAGNTNGTDPTLGVPSATVGDTLTFTLAYRVTNGPLTHAVVTDVLPTGYGDPTSISGGGTWSAATRTITWRWDSLDASGSVSYRVVVLAGANELSQPRRNTATIDSDQAGPATDVQDVAIPGEQKGETATPKASTKVTPPATAAAPSTDGFPGGGWQVALIAIAGLLALLEVLTPSRLVRLLRR